MDTYQSDLVSSHTDLGDRIQNHTTGFVMYPELWERHMPLEVRNFLNNLNWVEIKYLDSSGNCFHPDVESVPSDKGGIYLFSINSGILGSSGEYLAYIGRAQKTENQNIKKRCREYFLKFSRSDERPKITRLFNKWRKYLVLKYAVFDDENQTIIDIEKLLINALLPPFNDQIPDQQIRTAVNAF